MKKNPFREFNKMFKGKFVHLVTKRTLTEAMQDSEGGIVDIVNPFAIKGFFIKRDDNFYYLGEHSVDEATDVIDQSDFALMQVVGTASATGKKKDPMDEILDSLPSPGKKEMMN